MSRFEVGGVYNTNGAKHVCVSVSDRCVGIVELSEHRRNMKNPDFMGYDVEPYEECETMVFDGIEMATQCCDTDNIEDYEISSEHKIGEEFLEPICEFKQRYSRECQTEERCRRKKKEKPNALAGIVLIVLIVLFVRACCS